MSIASFLEKINNNIPVSFDETIAVITENYQYHPTEFSNGLNEHTLINQAGTNEGSCKIFAFAKIHQLDQQQTLNLFGEDQATKTSEISWNMVGKVFVLKAIHWRQNQHCH